MQSDGSKPLPIPEPAVTIIVVPRERFSYSQASLESLYANTNTPFRLVYVDAGSPPHIKRYLESQSKEKGFQLIRTERYLSPNQARNTGLRSADTKYVLFLDNDVEVAPGWLSALLRCAEETNASVVGPLYCIGRPVHQVIHVAGGEACIREMQGYRHLHEKHRFCDQRVTDVRPQMRREASEIAEFHCMLVRREVFDRLGALDEALRGTREHLDLCLMVREAGGSVWFEPDAVVTFAPDSTWPVVPPSFEWTDIPFYLLRWSEAWTQASLRHFEKKWNLETSGQLANNWLLPQRRIPLRRFRERLHRLLGVKLADHAVDAVEQFFARKAARKTQAPQRQAAAPREQLQKISL
jgi:GT2 family glycosyltransferase